MKYLSFDLREYFPDLPCLSKAPVRSAPLTQTQPWDDGCDAPSLTAYIPENSREIDPDRKRTSVIICPGGGYCFLSFREAEPVALALMARGYNAFVLRYDVAPARYPLALTQLAAAVALVRSQAALFNADPAAVAVCGFSAGAHLAASLGVLFGDEDVTKVIGKKGSEIRPDGMVLAYPVITSGEFAHRGSIESLLGRDASPDLVRKMSLEEGVSEDTPPAFIWHTFPDGCVPVENSLLFAQALRAHGVPFALHIFPEGDHGLSLCTREVCPGTSRLPDCSDWLGLCDKWLRFTLGRGRSDS